MKTITNFIIKIMKHFDQKHVYDFHIALRDKHLAELTETGETVCNSPFIRKLIYDELKGQKYKTEIVGHGGCVYRKGIIGYNPKLAMHNLSCGRYAKDGLLYEYEKYYYTGISIEEIETLFDSQIDKDTKFEIVTKASNYAKIHSPKVWLFQDPQKTIKKISLLSNLIQIK